ncbi:MAG: glycosyltransferase [Candidatus Thorarchaeota archaeon]
MNILVLQETDWLTRGPNTQHHVFERISKNRKIQITVFDYDIDRIMRSKSLFIKKHYYSNIHRAIENSNINLIRTAHIQVPYLRRISSIITNFLGMLKLLRKNRLDIIFGFSLTNGLMGLLLSKLYKIPFIFYYIDKLHTLVPLQYVRKIAMLISRLLFKYSDKIIVVTKLLQQYVLNEGIKPEKVKILLNGISLENTVVNKNKLEKLKKKYSIKQNDFVLFFMGYFYDFAGLKEIIDYYNSDVLSGKLQFKLFLVGDGGIYNQLIKHCEKIKADWVYFTGRLPFFEITEYIELSDLCLMSFDLNEITREITPVKILEYIAMKKPVLSNSLPGVINEIGKDNGVIYAKNQHELIKKIEPLSLEKEKLREIGNNGFNFIKKYYTWPIILREFKTILINQIRLKRKNHSSNFQ